jgi:hypothetical protein
MDERLLRSGLVSRDKPTEYLSSYQRRAEEAPLHIRRTLDQAYFLTLADTSHRDKDQVVYRGTTPTKKEISSNEVSSNNVTRVVMVDQLWMWILDESGRISVPKRRSVKMGWPLTACS